MLGKRARADRAKWKIGATALSSRICWPAAAVKCSLSGPQLPLPPMLMFDRISEMAETGGEYGKGLVRAVLEVKPDLWFFPCHFKGDPVMPGLPRPRCAVAIAGLLPRLARLPPARAGRWVWASSSFPAR